MQKLQTACWWSWYVLLCLGCMQKDRCWFLRALDWAWGSLQGQRARGCRVVHVFLTWPVCFSALCCGLPFFFFFFWLSCPISAGEIHPVISGQHVLPLTCRGGRGWVMAELRLQFSSCREVSLAARSLSRNRFFSNLPPPCFFKQRSKNHSSCVAFWSFDGELVYQYL